MLKKLRILLLALLTALCCTVTAWADYDYIDRYDVTAAPNVDDGSLTITVDLTWTALEELPYGQELKIGVPNGSVRDEEALTDNIERLSFDNSTCTSTWTAPTGRERRLRSPTAGCRSTCIPSAAIP